MNSGRSLLAGVKINDTHWWVSGGEAADMGGSEIYNHLTNEFTDFIDLPKV